MVGRKTRHEPEETRMDRVDTTSEPWSFRTCIAGFTSFCVMRDHRNRGAHPWPFRPERSRAGPRVSKSRDTPQVSPAMQMLQDNVFAEADIFPV